MLKINNLKCIIITNAENKVVALIGDRIICKQNYNVYLCDSEPVLESDNYDIDVYYKGEQMN